MSFCCFSEGSAMFDVTPIENMFLLEYLPTAPENFLRVYLYGRMFCFHPDLGESLAKMAEALHMTEDEVLNAFSYWEQQGVVEKQTDNPPTYTFRVLNANASAAQNPMESDYYRFRQFNAQLQELFGAEHLLQPRQYSMANDWITVLGFEQDAALRLLQYEYGKGKGKEPSSVFRRADKRALEWAERGIRSLADVEAAIAYDDRAYAVAERVLRQLSLRRAPTVDELNTVKRWLYEWSLTEDAIIAACARTTASRSPSIAYLDAILKPGDGAAGPEFEAVKMLLRELGAVGGIPTPDQCRQYNELLSKGFEKETLALAAAQCARKGKHSFDDLLWMLQKWEEAGVHAYSEAEKYLDDMNEARRETHEMLKAAGLTRRPNADDIARYLQMKDSSPRALILYAAECANGTRVPMQYITKLLKTWADAGIRDVEAARASRGTQADKPAGDDRLNYQQHHYTEADFDENFYYDPTRDFLKGGENK